MEDSGIARGGGEETPRGGSAPLVRFPSLVKHNATQSLTYDEKTEVAVYFPPAALCFSITIEYLHNLSVEARLSAPRVWDVRDDSSDGDEDADYGFVAHCSAGGDPAEGYDGAGLYVPDDCARHGPRLGNDEELGHVDNAGEEARLRRLVTTTTEANHRETYHHNHDPSVHWYLSPGWECVHERNNI